MRPRKRDSSMRYATAAPDIPNQYMTFPTYEAANLRIAQIEYEKSIGEFRPPKQTPIQTKRAQKSLSRSVSFWMNTCRSMD